MNGWRRPRTLRVVDRPVRAALALGSGGARGYAHIGVIQELEARGVEIVAVAGSSMGALVGALCAAGRLDDYTEWVSELTELQVLRLMDVSLTGPGVMRAEKVFARMHELLEGASIEDLRVPYTAVATDLLARRAVWFQRGPVETAVRASVAMPGVFTPLVVNGRVLVDGGLMDPVPVAPVAAARADLTIAVDLGGERGGVQAGTAAGSPVRDPAGARPVEEWAERFRRRASSLLGQDVARSVPGHPGGAPVAGGGDEAAPDGGGDGGEYPAGLHRFDVMNLSLEAMQSVVTRYRLAGNAPDVLVTVPKDACRTLDFHRAAEMIALGRTLAAEALDRGPGVAGMRPGEPEP